MKTKYFILATAGSDTVIECDSLKECISLVQPGEPIYKLVRIGRVDKNYKYHPIKERKK